MNNEQHPQAERFTLEELKFGGLTICDHESTDEWNAVCYYRPNHPFARKAAEDELDRLNTWNREGANIRPVEYVTKPLPSLLVRGTFSKATPLTLTFDEKRRYLAEFFRSSEFTDSDKFKALQEDNRMLAMFSLGNGKEGNNG